MMAKDVPVSTWPKAHPCRNPCGWTRFSTPAFTPGSRVVISRSIHPWPSGLPHPQVEARDEPS